MATVLDILDFVVVLLVVVNVSLSVRKGLTEKPESPILTGCIVIAMALFALVSFLAAQGLAGGSGLSQGILLLFLAATAAASTMWRSSDAVR
jgi:hypothetical protein